MRVRTRTTTFMYILTNWVFLLCVIVSASLISLWVFAVVTTQLQDQYAMFNDTWVISFLDYWHNGDPIETLTGFERIDGGVL